MIKKLIAGLCFFSIITQSATVQSQTVQPLDEITVHEPAFTVILDRHIQCLCHDIVDLWQQAGYSCPDENLQILLDPSTQELDYETVLRALHRCVHSEWEPRSDEEKELVKMLEQVYQELTEEHDQLIKQLATRKIKCKCYSKVTARELVAWNACFEKAIVKNKLIVDNLNGVVQANDGCFTAGLINGNDIEDGAITNSKLADNSVTNNNLTDNSVTTNKIVDSAILPTKLSFNTVDVFADEPDLLRVYRGTVNSAGTVISGAGFTANKTGVGLYTVTFTQAYGSNNAYQIMAQPTTGFDRNVNITAQAAGSFSISIVNNANVVMDQDFMFCIIGNM